MSEVPSEERQGVDNPPSDAGSDAESSPAQTNSVSTLPPLRIWPAVLLLLCLWAIRIVPALFAEMSAPLIMARFMGPAVFAGLIVLWWIFLSRASLKEKVFGVLGLATIGIVTAVLVDKTLRGFGIIIYVVPWGITAFVVALILSTRLRTSRRTWLALLAATVGFGYWDLVRIDEIRGDFRTTRNWRWQPTAEDRFLRSLSSRREDDGPTATAITKQPLADPEWPSFRGPNRNGVQPGVTLAENWKTQPFKEIWRVPIGPGWSSFSVAGNRLFTEEQRGEHEVVVCYDANSGSELWVHEETSRFWEAVGGAGPRATPTLSEGKLFALGARGVLNRLDPITGEQIWQRDLNDDAKREPPDWGYASSPLVTRDVVIVHSGGPEDKGLLAYDVETGDLRWTSPSGDHSYSSPQLSTVNGKQCVLMLTNKGITFVDPADGKMLGKHDWEYDGYRVLQPLVLEDSSVLLGSGMGAGTRRIEVRWDGEQFAIKTDWTARRMSPDFNDYVAHKGYLYGFDRNIFACVDLATGERKWKKGRYGHGQVLLLPSGDQLLVLSEDGELILLRATPKNLVELTRFQVLKGRTWNHPVLAGNRLYVRNGEEAACFEVPTL